MGAYDGALHPWLEEEQRYLRAAVEAEVPVFGACLGSQLLAACLGAPVYPVDPPEVGEQSLEAVLGPGALGGLLADFAAERAEMHRHARTLFEAWWELARG